jgi:hypothetical protein
MSARLPGSFHSVYLARDIHFDVLKGQHHEQVYCDRACRNCIQRGIGPNPALAGLWRTIKPRLVPHQSSAACERGNAFRAGDYQAMRNRAFCLNTGCDGAVRIDRKASCVIRRDIMRKHAGNFDRSDEMHMSACTMAGM